MSKLLDRLERIGRGSPAAIGFAAARAERIPGMALIGVVSGSSNSTRGACALAKMEVDGALIEGPASDAAIKKLAKALDNVPWGLRLQELKGEEASGLKREWVVTSWPLNRPAFYWAPSRTLTQGIYFASNRIWRSGRSGPSRTSPLMR